MEEYLVPEVTAGVENEAAEALKDGILEEIWGFVLRHPEELLYDEEYSDFLPGVELANRIGDALIEQGVGLPKDSPWLD